MSTTTLNLSGELRDYLLSVSLREPEVLSRLRAETSKLPMGNMQISPEQGQFMRLLIELIGAKKTLEVGVFTGYSSTSVALALPQDGKIIACDVSEEWTGIARRYWREAGVEHKIDLRLAPAAETLRSLLDKGEAGSFDFAFIDADKPNYATYFDLVMELIRPGAVIGVDNTLWHGKVVDESVQDEETLALRAFNRKVFQDRRVNIAMLPIGDGLTLLRKQ